MASITIKNVTKAFGDVVVLKEFDQSFADGEFITLLGPSGCGKTTMLLMGHLDSVAYIGAIGLGGTIFSVFIFKGQSIQWNHIAAFGCLILAVYFVFLK